MCIGVHPPTCRRNTLPLQPNETSAHPVYIAASPAHTAATVACALPDHRLCSHLSISVDSGHCNPTSPTASTSPISADERPTPKTMAAMTLWTRILVLFLVLAQVDAARLTTTNRVGLPLTSRIRFSRSCRLCFFAQCRRADRVRPNGPRSHSCPSCLGGLTCSFLGSSFHPDTSSSRIPSSTDPPRSFVERGDS